MNDIVEALLPRWLDKMQETYGLEEPPTLKGHIILDRMMRYYTGKDDDQWSVAPIDAALFSSRIAAAEAAIAGHIKTTTSLHLGILLATRQDGEDRYLICHPPSVSTASIQHH